MADIEKGNVLLIRQGRNDRLMLAGKEMLGPHQIQVPNDPGIVADDAAVGPQEAGHLPQNPRHFMPLLRPQMGNIFVETDHSPRLDIDCRARGGNIMDNACDPIAVGVFDRQDIAAISAGQDTIR